MAQAAHVAEGSFPNFPALRKQFNHSFMLKKSPSRPLLPELRNLYPSAHVSTSLRPSTVEVYQHLHTRGKQTYECCIARYLGIYAGFLELGIWTFPWQDISLDTLVLAWAYQ